jgi:predicted transcriptional regulator
VNTMNTNTATTQPNKSLTQLREQQSWELRIQCYSQAQIAEILGISQSAVSQILKRVGTRLYEQFAEGAAQRIAEQTDQLLSPGKLGYLRTALRGESMIEI